MHYGGKLKGIRTKILPNKNYPLFLFKVLCKYILHIFFNVFCNIFIEK